jgi:hypothetical protein
MSTTNPGMPHPPLGVGAATGFDHEAELLTRRALGLALNAVWSDDAADDDWRASHAVGRADPTVARRAIEVLRERVPTGRELALAVDLLERAERPDRRADVSSGRLTAGPAVARTSPPPRS